MRGVRWLIVAGALGLGLGCSGLGEKGLELAGGELDVAEGADARLPEGFPLPPPPGGTLTTVVRAGLMGTSTVSAIYELDGGADLEVVLEPYAAVMEAAGMAVSTSTSDGTRVVSGTKDQATWSAVAAPRDGKVQVTLVLADVGT